MTAEDIRDDLRDRWGGVPAVELCLQIVDYIDRLGSEQSRILTYRNLANALGKEALDVDLLVAINILASSKIAALDPKFMFIDEDEAEYIVEPLEVSEAEMAGEFIHPETGAAVRDFQKRLVPFFVPSDRLLEEASS